MTTRTDSTVRARERLSMLCRAACSSTACTDSATRRSNSGRGHQSTRRPPRRPSGRQRAHAEDLRRADRSGRRRLRDHDLRRSERDHGLPVPALRSLADLDGRRLELADRQVHRGRSTTSRSGRTPTRARPTSRSTARSRAGRTVRSSSTCTRAARSTAWAAAVRRRSPSRPSPTRTDNGGARSTPRRVRLRVQHRPGAGRWQRDQREPRCDRRGRLRVHGEGRVQRLLLRHGDLGRRRERGPGGLRPLLNRRRYTNVQLERGRAATSDGRRRGRRGGLRPSGYDFTKLPRTMTFQLGFSTPTNYVNCVNYSVSEQEGQTSAACRPRRARA